jgi:hypothetical protein
MEDLRRSAILRSSSTGNCSTARSRPASKVRGECAGADAIASRGGATGRDQSPLADSLQSLQKMGSRFPRMHATSAAHPRACIERTSDSR